AAAYRPTASPPRKYKAPQPGDDGVSPPDDGVPTIDGPLPAPRQIALGLAPKGGPDRFVDAGRKSSWDVAGRASAGEVKGWTLAWLDSVQVKWFAWAAEHPQTSVYAADNPKTSDLKKALKEVAGTAEFLRLLPKPFATLKAIDTKRGTITLLA